MPVGVEAKIEWSASHSKAGRFFSSFFFPPPTAMRRHTRERECELLRTRSYRPGAAAGRWRTKWAEEGLARFALRPGAARTKGKREGTQKPPASWARARPFPRSETAFPYVVSKEARQPVRTPCTKGTFDYSLPKAVRHLSARLYPRGRRSVFPCKHRRVKDFRRFDISDSTTCFF